MTNEEAKKLIEKYNTDQCTEAEKALVEQWFLSFNEHDIDLSQEQIENIGHQIYAELPIAAPVKKINLWTGIAAIAAITLLTIGFWHIFDRHDIPKQQVIAEEIAPGGNKAILTLGNGQTISLNGNKNAIVIIGNGIIYTDGTRVTKGTNTNATQTLTTPTGGEYQIILADGTKVWLNAESSLTYPTNFEKASERNVQLTGEAYFKVKKLIANNGKKVPFYVSTSSQKVEVLGTSFNINSYLDNNNTITTLLEGSVKVSKNKNSALLKPGQQALVSRNEIKVQDADMETAMAWKNGRIEFKDADLKEIMKQVSRWYNIGVEYQGDIPKRKFNGSISRKSNLSVLLKILAYSDIHFSIVQDNNQNKLIVTP
jgi:transmembrane sensor